MAEHGPLCLDEYGINVFAVLTGLARRPVTNSQVTCCDLAIWKFPYEVRENLRLKAGGAIVPGRAVRDAAERLCQAGWGPGCGCLAHHVPLAVYPFR